MPGKRFSLQIKILLLTGGLMGSALAITLYQVNDFVRATTTVQMNKAVHDNSGLLNILLSPYSTSSRLPELKDFFDEFLRQGYGHIRYMVVSDGTHILMQSGAVPRGPLPEPSDLKTLEPGASNIIHVRQPLLLTRNQIGYAQYGYAIDWVISQHRQMLRNATLYVSILFTVAFLIIAHFFRRLSSRMTGMAGTFNAIADGDYQRRVATPIDDELGDLSRHFNRMAAAVQERWYANQQALAEIAHLNTSLEERVQTRTRELYTTNQELRNTMDELQQAHDSLVQAEKMAALGRLVAVITHELNTPIGNTRLSSSALHNELQKFSGHIEKGEIKRSILSDFISFADKSLSIMENNTQRAVDLISAFKRVAIDQTGEQRRTFDLDTMTADLLLAMRPLLEQAGCIVTMDIPAGITMNSYPGQLGQVLTNLLDNALRHAFDAMPAGSHRVHIQATQKENGRINLQIADNGCGIAPEHINKIFDPFFTTRLGQGGSGLGLSISFKLVTEVLGGHIDVISTAQQGTTFTLHLPLCAPEQLVSEQYTSEPYVSEQTASEQSVPGNSIIRKGTP